LESQIILKSLGAKKNRNGLKQNGQVVTIEMFTSACSKKTIFRKAPPSVVSGYGKRSINLNKVVANFEKQPI
jgi:hypothetical protein